MNNKSAKRLNWNNFKFGIALLSLLLAVASDATAQSKPAAKEPCTPGPDGHGVVWSGVLSRSTCPTSARTRTLR